MICEAILKIKADAQVSVSGKDIDTCTITWHDDNPTGITKDQIKTKINETAYIEKRASEYKELKEQFDLLYHDMTAGKGDSTGEWYKHIKAVKDANPKG